MKKIYKYAVWALCAAFTVTGTTACSSDKDDDPELESKYLTIEGAEYRSGNQPSGDESLSNVDCNESALAGGMNFISVASTEAIDRFYLAIDGVEGYLEYAPEEEYDNNSSDSYSYLIPVMYSSELGNDMTMLLSARKVSGALTERVRKHVEFVESLQGDLAINLTFENDKDIDLHLICPNGTEIYFGNRGGEVYDEKGDLIGKYGLDHDSNPNCYIDGLNNENIVIPEQFVMNGEYTVKVNMYRNCNSSISTGWSIVTRYKGNIIRPNTGANPARGTYAVGAGDDDHTTVMTFKITDANGQLPGYGDYSNHSDYQTMLNFALGTTDKIFFEGNAYDFRSTPLSDAQAAKVRNHINQIAD